MTSVFVRQIKSYFASKPFKKQHPPKILYAIYANEVYKTIKLDNHVFRAADPTRAVA